MALRKFPVLIRACWFGLNHHFSRRISYLPITTVQYTVLRTLFDFSPKKLSQRELSILIVSNKNNLSSIIKRLQQLKYIELSENRNDKRENHISLSKRGKKIFLLGRKEAISLQKKLMSNFSKDDINSIYEYLECINKKIPRN